MRRLAIALLIGALLGVGAMFIRSAAAEGPLVGATNETVDPGGSGSAQLFAQGFPEPGLGAWTIDIAYDPSIITVTGCSPVEGNTVCNPEYASDKVRTAGADAFGLDGDSVLVEIEFTCSESGGTSPLDVQPRDVSDATVGGPVLVDVDVADGSVSCSAAAPPPTPAPKAPDAGTGGGTPEAPWQVLATLAMIASAGVIFVAGVRVFARRES